MSLDLDIFCFFLATEIFSELLRLFFRDYKNFRECENCLTSPKPHQEEIDRKSLFSRSIKPFIFGFEHSILSFQILDKKRDIPKAGNSYPKTFFFKVLNKLTSVLLLILDLLKV